MKFEKIKLLKFILSLSNCILFSTENNCLENVKNFLTKIINIKIRTNIFLIFTHCDYYLCMLLQVEIICINN